MSFVNQWVLLESNKAISAFLLRHLDEFTLDETTEDVRQHLTYQLKAEASRLFLSDQREKALLLADSLLFLNIILPPQLSRTRNLAKARALMIQFNFLRASGKNEIAVHNLREANRLCQENNSPLEAIRCQMGLVDVLARQGNFEEALSLAEVALQQAEAYGDKILLALVLNHIASAYHEKDDYTSAVEKLTRSIRLFEEPEVEDKGTLSCCYHDLALNYLFLNRFQEAIEMAGKHEEISREIGDTVAIGRAKRLIGSAYFMQGNFSKALRAWDSALSIYRSQGSPLDAHAVNRWRCECLIQLNRLEEALDDCEKLVAEAEAEKWVKDLGIVTYRLALIQMKSELYERARESFNRAAKLLGDVEATNWVACLRLDQAELLVKLGDYTTARHGLAMAYAEFEHQQMYRWMAQTQLVQARIALLEGNLNQAGQIGEKLLEVTQLYDLPSLNYQIWQLLGDIAEQKQQQELALRYYEESVTQLERLRGTVMLEWRGDFLKDKMSLYETMVLGALSKTDVERAYDFIERSKSRALTELLANQVDVRLKVREPSDAILVEQFNRLREEYTHQCNLLNQVEELPTGLRGKPDIVPTLSQSEQLHNLERQMEQILRQLQINNPAYAEELNLPAAQNQLPFNWLNQDTALLEYYIAGNTVLAIALAPGREPMICQNLISQAEVQNILKRLSPILQNLPPAMATRFLPNTQVYLSMLYQKLVKPFEYFLADFTHLIVVPHGILHYLPFQAFYNGEAKRYLVQDFKVSYLPAASQLQYYRKRAADLQRQTEVLPGLVMGLSGQKSLPFAGEEAREIATKLGTRTRLYLDNSARRSQLEEFSETYQVIHLATHGRFRHDAPLFSFLELADGQLLTVDLFNLNLKAQLVTLSACESGLNTISGGDELVGLSRACFYAGAASLLLSLWRVEDRSTTCLMKEFYGLLTEGNLSKGEALRQAQCNMLEGKLSPQGTNYQHPYFWAPFILIGDSGKLYNQV